MSKKPTYNELLEKIRRLEESVQAYEEQIDEQKILDNESRFKALSEAAHEGIFIHENGVCLEVNSAGCEMFGIDHDDFIGMHALSIFTDETKQLVVDNIRNEVTEGYEAVGIRKDGSTFNAEIRGKNYFYRGRNVRIAAIRDITSQKMAERTIKESESKFREVVENAADGILLGNLSGHMIEVNETFLKMTGFSREEIVGQHIKKIFASNALSEKPLRFDLLNKGQSIILEREILGKDGERIPVEMNSKRPHANYYLTIIRDLRERRRAAKELERKNKELQLAKEKAEESDRLKSSFLANMSHEIRTPMNGILGFAELLNSDDRDEQSRKEYINVIISSGQQLLNIINDVLEISRIETGQIKVSDQKVNANSLLKEMELFFQPLAIQNHNKIILDIPPDTEKLYFVGDQSKVRQVLTNLINNALKFTLNGSVTVGYVREEETLKFFIRDTGIGIPEEYLDKIFDRFLQAEYQDQAKQRGTGLGLAICKKLVELMQGEIWVETEINKGSTFYFSIPLQKKS